MTRFEPLSIKANLDDVVNNLRTNIPRLNQDHLILMQLNDLIGDNKLNGIIFNQVEKNLIHGFLHSRVEEILATPTFQKLKQDITSEIYQMVRGMLQQQQ